MATSQSAFKTYQTRELGGQTYDIAPGANYNVIETAKNAQGQDITNIDQRQWGGGTGWTLTSSLNAPAPPPPQSQQQVQPYLDAQQQAIANPAVPVRSAAEIQSSYAQQLQVKDANGNVIARPDAPKMLDKFNELREERGVAQLENSLNELKAQEQEVMARNQARTSAERQVGRGITTGVAAGRIGEIETQERANLEFVQRQANRITDQLNTAYNGIKLIMDLTQQDYQNAVQSWDSQYKQHLDMIELVQGQQKFDADQQQRAFDNRQTEMNSARAALQVYAGMISDNQMAYGLFSDSQKLEVNKLEVQAGLPAGFLSQIKAKPMAITQLEDGRTQVLVRDANGSVSAQIYGTASKGSGGLTAYQAASLALDAAKFQQGASKDAYNANISAAVTVLKNVSSDAYVDESEAKRAYGNILNIVGGDSQQAQKLFNDAFNQAGKVKYGNYAF